MKKLSTGIRGIDTLFYGGIQLNDQDNNNGLIIAIQGARGCNKTILAMQLMYGLTKSLNREKIFIHKSDSLFYSLDKGKEALNDLYLDLLINQHINEYIASGGKIYPNIVNYIFNLEEGSMESLYDIIGGRLEIGKLFRKRMLYYNSRTNSIHLNVNDVNIGSKEFFRRKYECIGQYIDELSQKCIEHDFINADFNGFTCNVDKDGRMTSTGDVSPIIRFQNTFINIANLNEVLPCIVLDGLTLLTENDLHALPYSELERILRRKAKISILVFDDKTDLRMNADIVIELRSKESSTEEYLYNELHISKSVFQNVALGWHQYKKRDDGISVFPSLHMLLSRRNYLPHGLLMWNKSVLEDTFDDYENNKLYCEHNDIEYCDYVSNELVRKRTLLYEIYSTHKEISDDEREERQRVALKEILSGTINNDTCSLGWENHFPSTAIIGNPNSYKRQFAIAGAFDAAKRKEHTIFVLFDKNEADMRRRIFCPGMLDVHVNGEETDETKYVANCSRQCDCCSRNCKLKKCYECYEHLHFFQIRMGCISAEEFFDALLRLIKRFADDKKQKPCHIVIDDLQKLDYSFPFLKSTSLFLSTLVSLCRENYAELKMICDKKASVVDELCSLSDNVLCVKKDEGDTKGMIVYLERNLGGVKSTGLCKYKIDDSDTLFRCNGKDFNIETKNVIPNEIGSMKEFWRKSYNFVRQEPCVISIKNESDALKKNV